MPWRKSLPEDGWAVWRESLAGLCELGCRTIRNESVKKAPDDAGALNWLERGLQYFARRGAEAPQSNR
jgi:hypothetical protein